jgi:hypothetical protein
MTRRGVLTPDRVAPLSDRCDEYLGEEYHILKWRKLLRDRRDLRETPKRLVNGALRAVCSRVAARQLSAIIIPSPPDLAHRHFRAVCVLFRWPSFSDMLTFKRWWWATSELAMSFHRLSTATRPFPLSPDIYGVYRPAKSRWWLAYLSIGVYVLALVGLMQQYYGPQIPSTTLAAKSGGLIIANPLAESVGRNAGERTSAATLPITGNGADRTIARPEDAMASVETRGGPSEKRVDLAEAAPASAKPGAKHSAVKRAQPVRQHAGKTRHREAQGNWRNNSYSWGRYGGGNPNGGWSIN